MDANLGALIEVLLLLLRCCHGQFVGPTLFSIGVQEGCVGQSCVGSKVAGGRWVQDVEADISEPATNAGTGHDGSFKG